MIALPQLQQLGFRLLAVQVEKLQGLKKLYQLACLHVLVGQLCELQLELDHVHADVYFSVWREDELGFCGGEGNVDQLESQAERRSLQMLVH